MPNVAFVEYNLRGHAVSAKEVQTALERACKDLPATMAHQHSYRDNADGVHLILVLKDETIGDITVEVHPTRLGGSQSFTAVYQDAPVTTVEPGEPFWHQSVDGPDVLYSALRIRTAPFTQEHSIPLMGTVRELVGRLTNSFTNELWPEDFKSDGEMIKRLNGLEG